MKLILNQINGEYLTNIILNAAKHTEEVLAAVAYANTSKLLFDWCVNNKIPLKFWGKLDATVPVSVPVLDSFLRNKNPIFVCKLVQHHHAKVIWWRGYGVYIGSANLTDRAWYTNIEAGCFFEEDEINSEMSLDLEAMFRKLDDKATPLTDEVCRLMESRSKELNSRRLPEDKFWSNPSLKKWGGLTQASTKVASQEKRRLFLEEWYSTLQELRNIAALVSNDENRPAWVDSNVPAGAQADQFLHAHYYQNTFNGQKANYQKLYDENKASIDLALNKTIQWWRSLDSAPTTESEMLNEHAPFIRDHLSQEKILNITYPEFESVCSRVHAFKDYARRVRNEKVFLPDGIKYTVPQKTKALANRVWSDSSGNGSRVTDMLSFVLYGGSLDQLPERLWQAINDPEWKIDGFGIGILGEIVGWALPDIFPPRNGRTSKALRSLGYNVRVYTE